MHLALAPRSLVVLALTLTVFAASVLAHSAAARRQPDHADIAAAVARRSRQDLVGNLEKRQSGSGRATFYDPSTGAGHCGQTFPKSAPIVAVNSAQFKLSDCFKWITVTANGKTASAQITDSCPGCPYGALDFSPSFFQQFASLDDGVFQMSWSLGGSSSNQQQQSSSSSRTRPSSTTSQYTPTSTRTRTSSSQTPTSTPSSSSSSSSSSTSSSSSSSTASSSSSSSAASTSDSATSTPTSTVANNLFALNQAVNGFLAMAKGQQGTEEA